MLAGCSLQLAAFSLMRPQMRQHRVDPGTWPRDGSVETFVGEQQRSGDFFGAAKGQKRLPQGSGVVEPGEMVKGADREHARRDTPCIVAGQA